MKLVLGMQVLRILGAPVRLAVLLLGGTAIAVGCDDGGTTRVTGPDRTAPFVAIDSPTRDARMSGDSALLVQVRVSDEQGPVSLVVTATAVTATGERVALFAPQTVEVNADRAGQSVRQTVAVRLPRVTAPATASAVQIEVVATDRRGNRSDPVRTQVLLVRPEIRISLLRGDSVLRAGRRDSLRIQASDPVDSITGVRVLLSGAIQDSLSYSLRFAPARARVDTVIGINVPATGSGRVVIRAVVETRNRFGRTDSLVARVADRLPPVVNILEPGDSGVTRAVGDSVFVRARITDLQSIAQVRFTGIALRGSRDLGNQQVVQRFQEVTVNLRGTGSLQATTDTVLTRFLRATADTLSGENVLVIVTAQDTSGNIGADTSLVVVRGPNVQIVSPTEGTAFRAGTQVPVRIRAGGQQITSLLLRLSGAINRTDTLNLSLRPAVDTTLLVNLPVNPAADSLRIQAIALTAFGETGSSRAVTLRVLPAERDRVAPTVTFNVTVPTRGEATDSLSVQVSATDNSEVRRVGATLIAFRRTATGRETVGVRTDSIAGRSGLFRLALSAFNPSVIGGILTAQDTARLEVEITAFATDTAGNCGAAVAPGSPQSLPCESGPGGATVSPSAGARSELLLTRGRTVPVASGDRIADIVSDGSRVFLSNISRNRVEVLPVGGQTFIGSVGVGSQPFGLAVSRDNNTLFVANSGGTNISVVPIRSGGQELAALRENEAARILTPNIRLFNVTFTPDSVPLPNDTTRKVEVQVAGSVTAFDFSDRPQFLAQTASGQILYSTRPTGSAPNGTIRRYLPNQNRVEFFVDYAGRPATPQFVIINARDAALVISRRNRLFVAPTGCATGGDSAITNFVDSVAIKLAQRGCLTRLLNVDINQIGLSDTTFVAVSGDRSTVTFGEGARSVGRIISFRERQDSAGALLVAQGDVSDLVGNASERVIGLSLNQDGSLGAARGGQTYFFTPNLRLQGSVVTGTPSGGVALDPRQSGYPALNPANRFAFVSGTENGSPYLDVVDAFGFASVRRLPLREAITGALIAVPRTGSDPAEVVLHVYGITASGVVDIPLTSGDLRPRTP